VSPTGSAPSIQYESRRARRDAEAAAVSVSRRPRRGAVVAAAPATRRERRIADAAARGPVGRRRAVRASAVPAPCSTATRRPLGPGAALTVALVQASVVETAHRVREHCWGRRGLAVTSVALAACLVVTDTAPRTAVAAPIETVAPGPLSQDFRVFGTSPDTTARADFTVVGRTADGVALARLPGSGETVARPVAGTVPSAGNFGGRNVAGCAACSTNHQGTDFAAAAGTPVLAVMSGTVESAGVLGGYGNQVLLRHRDGTETRYGHLSVIGVRPGQVVSAGERIGLVGSTGVSTGPHLHFEVILGGRPVDPEPWLDALGLLH
jgi:hypothetical protein